MPTSFPMSLPHAPTGFVNQAALDASFTTPINDLYALLAPLLADTGWLNMASLQSGWSNDSTVPQARQIGNVVYLVGGIVNASFSATSFTTACTLPSSVAAPPGTRVLKVARGSSTLVSDCRLLTDRSLQVLTSAASSNAFRLDGLFYVTT